MVQTGVKSFGCENRIAPGIAEPVVELDLALGGVGLEIGRDVADAKCHGVLLFLGLVGLLFEPSPAGRQAWSCSLLAPLVETFFRPYARHGKRFQRVPAARIAINRQRTTTRTSWTRLLPMPWRFHGGIVGWMLPASSVARHDRTCSPASASQSELQADHA